MSLPNTRQQLSENCMLNLLYSSLKYGTFLKLNFISDLQLALLKIKHSKKLILLSALIGNETLKHKFEYLNQKKLY